MYPARLLQPKEAWDFFLNLPLFLLKKWDLIKITQGGTNPECPFPPTLSSNYKGRFNFLYLACMPLSLERRYSCYNCFMEEKKKSWNQWTLRQGVHFLAWKIYILKFTSWKFGIYNNFRQLAFVSYHFHDSLLYLVHIHKSQYFDCCNSWMLSWQTLPPVIFQFSVKGRRTAPVKAMWGIPGVMDGPTWYQCCLTWARWHLCTYYI